MLCITERIDDIDNTLATFDRAVEKSERDYGRLHPSDVDLIGMFRKGHGTYAECFSAIDAVLGTQGYTTRSLSYLEAFTRPEFASYVAGSIRIVQPFLVDTGRGRIGCMAYAGVGYPQSSRPPSFDRLRGDDTSADRFAPSHFAGLWSPDLGDGHERAGLRFFHHETSLDRLSGIVAQHEGDIARAIQERGRVKSPRA